MVSSSALIEVIDLNRDLIPHPGCTFFYNIEGSRITDSFIPFKSKFIVDKSITPKHGDLVHCILNGTEFIKRLIRVHNGIFLTGKGDVKPVRLHSEMAYFISGVVTHIIIDSRDLE